MTDAPPGAAVESASAERVRFVEPAGTPGRYPHVFTGPYPRVAVSQAITVEELLAGPPWGDLPRPSELNGGLARPPHACESPFDELLLLFLPAGSATPVELQRQAEQWMNDASLPADSATIDIVLQSDRILWRAGRAVVLGAARRWPELRAGLVHFAYYEAELTRLERELEADWNAAEADVVLTHAVDMRSLERRNHVDAMTCNTALRRIRYTRLAPHLEKSSAALPGVARRLFSELALQAEVTDRLRYVDDRLEVYEDLYETANDRLAEYAYYRSEYRLEAWIIVLLLLEVVLLLGEMWLSWRLAE